MEGTHSLRLFLNPKLSYLQYKMLYFNDLTIFLLYCQDFLTNKTKSYVFKTKSFGYPRDHCGHVPLGIPHLGVATADLFEGYVISDVMKDPPDFMFIIIGNLFQAFAMCTLYSKWSRGHHSAKEGAEFGLWFGVFVGLGIWMIQYATANLMALNGYLIDAVLEIVYYAVAGVVIAMMYKATSPKS